MYTARGLPARRTCRAGIPCGQAFGNFAHLGVDAFAEDAVDVGAVRATARNILRISSIVAWLMWKVAKLGVSESSCR